MQRGRKVSAGAQSCRGSMVRDTVWNVWQASTACQAKPSTPRPSPREFSAALEARYAYAAVRKWQHGALVTCSIKHTAQAEAYSRHYSADTARPLGAPFAPTTDFVENAGANGAHLKGGGGGGAGRVSFMYAALELRPPLSGTRCSLITTSSPPLCQPCQHPGLQAGRPASQCC